MATEVVGKVVRVSEDEERGGHVVEFWVGEELSDTPTLGQAIALLGNMDRLQRELFAMHVGWEDGEYAMEPDTRLSQCLAVYDEYDSGDGLISPLDRQWKTGQIADAIVTSLIEANVFGVWRTRSGEEETPEI